MRGSISTQVERLAEEHRPRLIIAGGSAYPRIIDFARFRAIADRVGAYLMVDMAHFAGLVAGGAHPSPLPHAHVVTTTTHKTLRGPRGGMILCNDPDIAKRIDSAVFPGLQGGPLMHVIAAKAVALGEALTAEFRGLRPARRRQRADPRRDAWPMPGCAIVSGGTDTHLLLVDLRPFGLTGRDAEQALERAGMTCNKNGIPFDPQKPTVTSGRPAGLAGGDDARFRRGRIPPDRRVDRRGAARSGADQPGRERGGREAGARGGRRRCAPGSRSTHERSSDDESGANCAGHGGSPARRRRGCAVRSAARMTPRSRIRGRPTIAARSVAGASAPIARPASRHSSGCSCAN